MYIYIYMWLLNQMFLAVLVLFCFVFSPKNLKKKGEYNKAK